MPRRARHLIPTDLPRRGEVIAGFALLVLFAHLLFAQLTFVLAIAFAGVSKASRWRLWWLTAPAAIGLAWTLAIGPRPAAAGFTAGSAQILGYFGGHPLGRLPHPHGAFAGIGGWLPRQFPLALIAAAAEAALIGWLDWLHTDEWAVPPPRRGLLAAAHGGLASRMIRAGAVVTRDGCVLGVAPASGARVALGWPEVAGGMLVAGADPRTLAVSSLQVVHAALRRRKPLIAIDLSGADAIAATLGAACLATGTPLRGLDESQAGRWLGDGRDGASLARVVSDRSAILFTLRAPDVAALVCAAILALGEELRRIGVDGDGLVWLYGYETLSGYEAPSGYEIRPDGLLAGLVAGGRAAGLPVLVTTTSPRAVADLAGLVGVVLVHQLTDAAAAGVLSARTGSRLVPPSWPVGEQAAVFPHTVGAGEAGLTGQGPFAPLATSVQYAESAQSPGLMQRPGLMWRPGLMQPPGPVQLPKMMQSPGFMPQAGPMQQVGPTQQMASMWQMPTGWQGLAMGQGSSAASELVPRPAVPARTLLSLGPTEFVLAVSAPRYRLVELGRAVPARLPRGVAR